ncbi:MAG: glutamine-hydrolyzing carbamoyl-phosphate synthase small subunit [Planctomycetota bacterium]
MNSRKPARLVLEDGTVLRGRSIGASRDSIGELVFNTSITGYQEILTDPSYRGQTVLLTQPHIGNYGVNSEDEESARLWLSGLIVREAAARASNFRSGGELSDYLIQHGVPGIERVDTRMVTRRVRTGGAMRVLITEDIDSPDADLVAKVRNAPSVSDEDHVLAVTTRQSLDWTRGHESPFAASSPGAPKAPERRHKIVAYDFGAKRNILRSLVASGFDVTVVPADTPAAAVLERKPAGVFLSNGPGDPAILHYAVSAAKELVKKVPVFGICLGHQILGQVFGAKTFKMKFGHHGGNQPVMDLTTEKVEITAQNHSFAVDPAQLPGSVEVTHLNLNDKTVEGIRHKELPVFSVQYHPEAAPGPHDSLYLFDRFRGLIDGTGCS